MPFLRFLRTFTPQNQKKHNTPGKTEKLIFGAKQVNKRLINVLHL